MMRKPLIRSSLRIFVPLSLCLLSGCSAIKAQKIAGDGNRLVSKGDYEVAMAKFNESIALKENESAHAGLAEVYIQQGKYAEAEWHARKAVELTKGAIDSASVKYNLILSRALLMQRRGGDAYEAASKVVTTLATSLSDPISKAIVKQGLLLQCRILEATAAPAETIKRLQDEQIQQRWPDDLDFRAEYAIALALNKEFDAANQAADGVMKLKTDHGSAVLAKSIVLASQGKTTEAKTMLGTILQDDRTRLLVLLGVTTDLRRERKNDAAVELLTMLAAIDAENYSIQSDLAFIYLDQEKFAESIDAHEKVLKYYPAIASYSAAATLAEFNKMLAEKPMTAAYDRDNLAGYYENLGFLYQKQKMIEKSVDAYERAASVKPSIAIYQNLAQNYDQMGNFEGAVGALERASKLEPENTDVLKALGTMAFKANQPEKAKEYFKKATSGKGNDAEAHLSLGIVLFNVKQFKEALPEFEAVTKLDSGHADAFFYLGLTHKNLGNAAESEKAFKRTTEIKVDYVEAYRELGNIAMERKKWKEAEVYYKLEDKYRGTSGKR